MGKYFYIYTSAILLALLCSASEYYFVFIELSGKLPLLLSVLLAAVFVRLARGMPVIPHEKIPAPKATIATKAFRHLINSYVQTFAIFLLAIFLNLGASSVDSKLLYELPYNSAAISLAIIDFLSIASLFYMVSADVKLAKVQADLIDEVVGQGGKKRAQDAVENVSRAFAETREVPAITRLDENGDG